MLERQIDSMQLVDNHTVVKSWQGRTNTSISWTVSGKKASFGVCIVSKADAREQRNAIY